jgi:hypothetical protein
MTNCDHDKDPEIMNVYWRDPMAKPLSEEDKGLYDGFNPPGDMYKFALIARFRGLLYCDVALNSDQQKWPKVLEMFDTEPTDAMDVALSIPDNRGLLLIMYACSEDAPAEVIQRFIDNDKIDKSMFQYKDKNGHLPFHYACKFSSKIEVVKMVLKHYPAAIHATNGDDANPLHLAACFNNNLEIVKYIHRQYPQAIRKKTTHDATPLAHSAYNNNNPEIVSFLIDQYPEALNEKDEDGYTPLTDAEDCNHGINSKAIVSVLKKATETFNSSAAQNIRKNETLQITTKCCLTKMKNDGITPRILATPMNDLTEPEFIFRVLDEFQNCGWFGLGDEVVARVVTNK